MMRNRVNQYRALSADRGGAMILLALGLALASLSTQAATLLSRSGAVELRSDERAIEIAVGDTLPAHFQLRAADGAYAQFRFEDGSIVSVANDSVISVPDSAINAVQLERGGLDFLTATKRGQVSADDYLLSVEGFLRLRRCDKNCREERGLHGQVSAGEVIIEYPGGRAVMRDKPFLAPLQTARPFLLAAGSALLAENNQLSAAAQAKQGVADLLKEGLEAFKVGDYPRAERQLLLVMDASPTEFIASYYLGLTLLQLDQKERALQALQSYKSADPQGARERKVGELITLLLTDQLQREVKLAMQQESALQGTDIEPNSVAVQPFVNKGNPAYASLAKGIAAMVISDLSQVPGLKVLERQKVQKLLDEIQLSQAGLVDKDAAVKAGRIIKAEKVILGNFEVAQ